MKLALRLAIWLLLPMTTVVLVNAGLRVRREHRLFEKEAVQAQRALGRALAAGISDGWASSPQHALHVLQDASQEGGHRLAWHPRGEASPWSTVEQADLDGRHEVMRRLDGRLQTLYPVFVANEPVGVISIEGSTSAERSYLIGSVLRTAVQTLVIVTLCMAAAVFAGLRLVGRPIEALAAHARSVGAGRFSSRVTERFGNELDDLAGELNGMAAQLEREIKQKEAALAQVRHADRLITVGQLSAGIAHELGTPLNVVLGRAQEIADGDVEGEPARENARTIASQVERISGIVRGLLDFARPRRAAKRDDDATALLQRVTTMLAPLARKRGVELVVEAHAPVPLRADPEQIEQVVVNLVMNAVQAMTTDGAVRTRADVVRRPAPGEVAPEREWARLRVMDAGPGIPEDIRDKVFDPFFTTKAPGDGTGLGLAVTWGLVAQNGGFVTFETEEGRGTTFDVWLPREEA